MPLTVGVQVADRDREVLASWTRSPSLRAGLAQRARVVLLAADGVGTNEIVRRVGLSKPAVIGWKRRYAAEGIAGLGDRPKSGRPPVIDAVHIVLATLEPPPQRLGVTHWSSRLLAKQLGISDFTVSTTWKKWGLQPWRRETFKFSTDPELEAKIRDVVGLYLNPPDKAIVLSVDEKSQIQALDRTAPVLPLRLGMPEKQTHDYVRHGTTTLFAALEVATGKVTDACYPRHRHEEFLKFLKQVAKTYPRVRLHIVADNYATHKHPAVKAWLARNPRITMHFTPTSGSWLNMVEIFFGIITRQAIRRGTFTSVKDLTAAIGTFIDAWNERCEPFVWTKTADQIIDRATRGKHTSIARSSLPTVEIASLCVQRCLLDGVDGASDDLTGRVRRFFCRLRGAGADVRDQSLEVERVLHAARGCDGAGADGECLSDERREVNAAALVLADRRAADSRGPAPRFCNDGRVVDVEVVDDERRDGPVVQDGGHCRVGLSVHADASS